MLKESFKIMETKNYNGLNPYFNGTCSKRFTNKSYKKNGKVTS